MSIETHWIEHDVPSRMSFNKPQRDGVSKVCEGLATAFAAIATIEYVGFGMCAVSAGVVLTGAALLVVAAW